MRQTSRRKDDGEVTCEQVTVLSFEPEVGARVDEDGRVLLMSEPASLTRIPVRILREAMTIKRVAGYWISWAEWFGPDDIRNHARWVPDEEYVRPGEGGLDGRLDVKVSAYWAVEREPRRARLRTSEAVVTFPAGEARCELVLERPEPQHPATLVVHLSDAWWSGGRGGRTIHHGLAGELEGPGGRSGEGRRGAAVHRYAECATGHLPGVAVR
ncbi:hypothetical protein [Kitasatospora purpeofusca]|uniref:Uncharacterized protein n=1 Tax=Kitasatospora purpeofusca TaxID=67352 RepID=A0ABZ1U6Q0_9ACTN|nr:hypothetical protein [Kitasatospora purpeofusca]